jgi:hypothetical protein
LERLAALSLLHVGMGSFDCVNASLRGAFTPLRMTVFVGPSLAGMRILGNLTTKTLIVDVKRT